MMKEVLAPQSADILQLSQLNQSRDLMQNAQYVNATYAVLNIETDKGGLPLSKIWEETEWMRGQLLLTDREKRPFLVPDLYVTLKQRTEKAGSRCVERSVMCTMMLFALRLVTAGKNKEDNPNAKVIRSIVRVLSEKMSENEERRDEMTRLLQSIDKDGDVNERDGSAIVEMGIDILADEPDWKRNLRGIVETYVQKADSLVDHKMGEAFDAVWVDLLEDSRFVQEMRLSTLHMNFNLNMLFNVFGLMYPDFYNNRCRGFQTLARVVGANPTYKDKDHHYAKEYFNKNEIEKLKYGFKSEDLLSHVKSIIEKNKKI